MIGEESDDAEKQEVDVVEQLRRLNAPAAAIAEAQKAQDAAASDTLDEDEESCFGLWEDSLYSFTCFLSLCSTGQWNYVVGGLGTAIRVGIPAERVLAYLEGYEVSGEKRKELFSDMMEIVKAVLDADRKVMAIKRNKD